MLFDEFVEGRIGVRWSLAAALAFVELLLRSVEGPLPLVLLL